MAKTHGLSRSTLLYYDRLGLLSPSGRSGSNYRVYTASDARRLEAICQYRRMGIPLKEIGAILASTGHTSSSEILKRRLKNLEREITNLRRQQRCIVDILKQTELTKESEMISKEKWVAVMRAAGMSDDDMRNWHIQFEKMEPQGHQEFLESLGIGESEINEIRDWSRKG